MFPANHGSAHLGMAERIRETFSLPRSNLLAVDDETRALRYPVVEFHRRQVTFLGLPIDTYRSGHSCPIINGLNQCAPDSRAAFGLIGKQILQIAGRFNRDGTSMKK